jgi:hypothetical protein
MGYTLQAIVGDSTDLRSGLPGFTVIDLAQGKGLVPISEAVRERYEIPFLEFGSDTIPEGIISLVKPLKKAAYLEAEFFGGEGGQSSAAWEDGRLVFGPVSTKDAINQALRFLGVEKKKSHDEFDALGLGRHRDTEKWV